MPIQIYKRRPSFVQPADFPIYMASLNPLYWYRFNSAASPIPNDGSRILSDMDFVSGTPTYQQGGIGAITGEGSSGAILLGSTAYTSNSGNNKWLGNSGTVHILCAPTAASVNGQWMGGAYQGFDREAIQWRWRNGGGNWSLQLYKAGPNGIGNFYTPQGAAGFPTLNEFHLHTWTQANVLNELPKYYIDGIPQTVAKSGADTDITDDYWFGVLENAWDGMQFFRRAGVNNTDSWRGLIDELIYFRDIVQTESEVQLVAASLGLYP